MSVPALRSHKKQQTMKTHLENMQNRNSTRLYGNCTERHKKIWFLAALPRWTDLEAQVEGRCSTEGLGSRRRVKGARSTAG